MLWLKHRKNLFFHFLPEVLKSEVLHSLLCSCSHGFTFIWMLHKIVNLFCCLLGIPLVDNYNIIAISIVAAYSEEVCCYSKFAQICNIVYNCYPPPCQEPRSGMKQRVALAANWLNS